MTPDWHLLTFLPWCDGQPGLRATAIRIVQSPRILKLTVTCQVMCCVEATGTGRAGSLCCDHTTSDWAQDCSSWHWCRRGNSERHKKKPKQRFCDHPVWVRVSLVLLSVAVINTKKKKKQKHDQKQLGKVRIYSILLMHIIKEVRTDV